MAPPFASPEAFLLAHPPRANPAALPAHQRHLMVTAEIIQMRRSERVRLRILGIPVPEWLLEEGDAAQEALAMAWLEKMGCAPSAKKVQPI
jgi:hypothetical protein